MKVMKNGFVKYDVILVDFGEAVLAGEQGGKRPAVIMQNNKGNLYSPATIVIPFTSKLKNLHQPTHALFHANIEKGLNKDSVILGECLRSISEQRILGKLGHLTNQSDIDMVERVKNAAFGD